MGSQIAGPQAADLSPQEAEERAELCFQLDAEIKAGLKAGREALWTVAEATHRFDEENGWSALGYENLGEWLADPEIGMTRSTYFRLTQSYRELAVVRQLPAATLADLDLSKVQIVLPKVKAGSVKLADAIEDVKHLGARDLRAKYMSRPDPQDLGEPDDRLDPGHTPSPMNDDGDDTPVNAGSLTPLGEDEGENEDGEIVDAVVVDEEPAQNAPFASGQVSPMGLSAQDVLERIDMALDDSSIATKLNALRKTREFLVALFPDLAGE